MTANLLITGLKFCSSKIGAICEGTSNMQMQTIASLITNGKQFETLNAVRFFSKQFSRSRR
ncbi:MAG: hypothetical protein ACR2L1_05705 [Pyrinomonadaceae bacterium]